MPGPVSATSITIWRHLRTRRTSTRSSGWVNLIALSSRLWIARSSKSGSPDISGSGQGACGMLSDRRRSSPAGPGQWKKLPPEEQSHSPGCARSHGFPARPVYAGRRTGGSGVRPGLRPDWRPPGGLAHRCFDHIRQAGADGGERVLQLVIEPA